MKKSIFAASLTVAMMCGNVSNGAAPRFEKVSDHCYYMEIQEGINVAAVITDEGILIVDPPQEPGLSVVVEGLKRITSKSVRWIVFTDYRFSYAGGARIFAEQGAQVLASSRLRALSMAASGTDSPNSGGSSGGIFSFPWLTFDHQMHLFPANLEIRITALENKARTGSDVVVYVPAEKVLFVGNLYEAARYPDIDTAAEGSALGWIDGLKQVVDSVPVLKPAIPPAKPASLKPEPKPEPEKTLEELIMVVSAHGVASNLQNMKDLLEACQKLRRDASRAAKTGRSSDSFLASPGADPYRGYGNLAPYVGQLFEDIAAAAERNK